MFVWARPGSGLTSGYPRTRTFSWPRGTSKTIFMLVVFLNTWGSISRSPGKRAFCSGLGIFKGFEPSGG